MHNSRAALIFVLCALAAVSANADEKAGPSASAPAKVENRVKEGELTTVKITPEAEKRLGIELATAEKKSIPKSVQLPGEIVVPAGGRIVVSAPIAGLVTVSDSSGVIPGQRVERGAALFRLQPGEGREGRVFVPADRISLARARADLAASRIESEGQLAQARVRVDAAAVKLKRADQLRQEGAGAQRAYDEARAEFDLSGSQRQAAEERVDTLNKLLQTLESDEQATLPIEAPLSGIVQAIQATTGQVVVAGAPLAEIVSLDPIWVRVPVYVGDLDRFRAIGQAHVRAFASADKQKSFIASRVAAPPSADIRAATVDCYFQLPNSDLTLLPGQRVEVELETSANVESVVVPHASILLDIYGGAWVYEAKEPQTFIRKRVEVERVVGNFAVLRRGVPAGTKVVTAGAAELFGTEFGVGK